jgi:hypothetical protein
MNILNFDDRATAAADADDFDYAIGVATELNEIQTAYFDDLDINFGDEAAWIE